MKTKNACAGLKLPEKLNHQLLGASLKSPGRVIACGCQRNRVQASSPSRSDSAAWNLFTFRA